MHHSIAPIATCAIRCTPRVPDVLPIWTTISLMTAPTTVPNAPLLNRFVLVLTMIWVIYMPVIQSLARVSRVKLRMAKRLVCPLVSCFAARSPYTHATSITPSRIYWSSLSAILIYCHHRDIEVVRWINAVDHQALPKGAGWLMILRKIGTRAPLQK